MINPTEAVKSIQSDNEYLRELQESVIEMCLRQLRWRVLNMNKDDFEDWILNSEITDFLPQKKGA